MSTQVRRGNRDRAVNVGDGERLVSIAAGAALAIAGRVRGAPMRSFLKFKGSYLLLRGITGYCPAYNIIGINTVDVHEPRQVIDQLAARYPIVRAVDSLAQQIARTP